MKQVVIRGPYDVAIVDAPTPESGANEIVVRTEVSGISVGTEMTLYRGTHPNLITKKWGYWTEYPIYPGYEVVGIVESVGKAVRKFVPGDRVVGVGPHAELSLIPDSYATKLPEEITSQEGTLAILGTTALHAIHRSGNVYGASVCIIGMGVVGMLTLLHAKLAGAGRLVAVDLNKNRLNIAASIEMVKAINPNEPECLHKINEITDGGADIVIEATGSAAAIPLAMSIARPKGVVIILGYHTKPAELLFGDDIFHKELDIRATKAMGPHPSLPPSNTQWGAWIPPRWTVDQSLEYVVHLMATEKLNTKFIITHQFDYKDIINVYKKIDAGKMGKALQIILRW